MYDPLEIFVVQPPNIEQNQMMMSHMSVILIQISPMSGILFLIIRPIFNIFHFFTLTVIMMVMMLSVYSAKYSTYMQYQD